MEIVRSYLDNSSQARIPPKYSIAYKQVGFLKVFFTPFPNVAGHIIQPISVGIETARTIIGCVFITTFISQTSSSPILADDGCLTEALGCIFLLCPYLADQR